MYVRQLYNFEIFNFTKYIIDRSFDHSLIIVRPSEYELILNFQ